MITRDEIARMTREEKWQTLEWLQESLDDQNPAWVGELLAERRLDLKSDRAELLALDQVEERFRARRG